MHNELIYFERPIQAGAMGYVHKSEGIHKIIEGIYQIIDGRIIVSNRVNDRLLARAAQ